MVLPGPPLAQHFTYQGTPYPLYRSDPFNTLAREMILTQRFWNGRQTGTHKRKPDYKNIPRNSGEGRGVGGGDVSINYLA